MTAAPSPTDPLGFDVLVDEVDIDPTGRSATGEQLVSAAIVHRLTCERLSCIDAPTTDADGYGVIDFGINVFLWVGEVVDVASAERKIPIVDEVLHRDPRIVKNEITVALAPAGATFPEGGDVAVTMSIVSTLTSGATSATITKVVGISQVTVAFLAEA